jgi:hypothetical protein
MEDQALTATPEYNFSAHEIAMVNAGTIHVLENDWLKSTGNAWVREPRPYVSTEESDRLSVAGSSYDTILDFDHAQEPAMNALTAANSYAYGVKRRVTAMLDEADAANTYPDGPAKYFEDQKREMEKSNKSFKVRLANLLGRFAVIR